MMQRFVIFLLILSAFYQTSAQVSSESHNRIRMALAERNYSVVGSELREIELKDPEGYRANNYDYLNARMMEQNGDSASAMAAYQRVVNLGSVLKPYALWHLSRLARATGNLTLERVYLQELLTFSPDSILIYPGARRMAQSWFDSGSFDLAIRQIEQMPKPSAQLPARAAEQANRDLQAFLANAYLRAGNIPKAKEIFMSLTTNLSNPAQPDDYALAGVAALDNLETPESTSQLSDYEHLRRASIYQFNRDFARARTHYAAILKDYPGSGIAPDAIFQTGRGFVQQGDFTEALKWFERLLEQYPEHPIAAETLLQTAGAYARVGKHHEAGLRYKQYIDKYPEGERVDRAYLNYIDVLRDTREETAAIKWIGTIRDKFKGKVPEALATFAEARIYLARSNWPEALTALEQLEKFPDLGGVNTPGGTNIAEVKFLRAYVLEQLHRYPEAIDLYLSIPDGRNEYYGGQASERLRLLSSNKSAAASVTAKFEQLKQTRPSEPDAARRALQAALRLTDQPAERSKLLAELRSVYAAIPAYSSSLPKLKLVKLGRTEPVQSKPAATSARPTSIGDELLFLGLYDEAAPEIERVRLSSTSDPAIAKTDLDYTIATFYTKGDTANRGSAFIESTWKMPADYQIELIPSDVLDLLYPAPYSESLVKFAPPRNVEPRFLLSLMRQESRFRADVKSYAAARGLMQFISTTASRIAAELGRENFRQDDLYDPATSILFGSHYVENLFKLFPNQAPAVAASYNGGEDNMKRWLARSKSDQPVHYIPEIAFAQSKDYVYRVMANYRMYMILYDGDLRRKVPSF